MWFCGCHRLPDALLYFNMFHTVFYEPIYNLLIVLIGINPWGNVALAVILTTIIVRAILYPLSKKALITQIGMQKIAPKIEELKKKYKDNREGLALATMAVYKENNVNPFASVLVLIIQIPVIIALYYIFFRSGLPHIKAEDLYSFITTPANISTHFFWLEITQKSWILAVLAGFTQFLQANYSLPKLAPASSGEKSFAEDFSRSMNIQMRFFIPVFMIFIAHSLSAAVAIYFVVGNLFTLSQEWYIRKFHLA